MSIALNKELKDTMTTLNKEVKDEKDRFATTKSELEKAIVNLERANHFYLVAKQID